MDSTGWASVVGLLVAFGGTAWLVSPASRVLGDEALLRTRILEQLALWAIFAAVLAVVLLWEREPLASLWLRPFAWRSVALGVAFAALQIWVIYPLRMRLLAWSDLPGFAAGAEAILALPLWFRVVAVIGAGVVEEAVFHGFALTRLGALFGSPWAAALVVVPAFALVHYPVWGPGPVLTFLVGGAVGAALFILSRDLLALIVCHVLVDAMGLVITPLYSQWWKR